MVVGIDVMDRPISFENRRTKCHTSAGMMENHEHFDSLAKRVQNLGVCSIVCDVSPLTGRRQGDRHMTKYSRLRLWCDQSSSNN